MILEQNMSVADHNRGHMGVYLWRYSFPARCTNADNFPVTPTPLSYLSITPPLLPVTPLLATGDSTHGGSV